MIEQLELRMHRDAVLKADNRLDDLGRLVVEALGTFTTSSRREHRGDNIPSEWGDVKPGRDEAISILMDRVKDALTSRMELDIDLKRKCELVSYQPAGANTTGRRRARGWTVCGCRWTRGPGGGG